MSGRLSASPDKSNVDLGSMTKAQLLEYAEVNGISGVSSSMLKADILSTIQAAQGVTE